jgi:uncharacterized protein
VNDLPLLELFTRLRESGLPLGIRDYEAVLQALQAGYGLPDRPALARLCRTLWVRSIDERQLFDYYFEQLIGSEMVSEIDNLVVTAIQKQQQRAIRVAISAALSVLLVGVGIALWTNNPSPTPKIIPTPKITPPPTPRTSKENSQLLAIMFFLLFCLSGIWLFRILMQRRKNSLDPSEISPVESSSKMNFELLPTMGDEVLTAQVVQQMTTIGYRRTRDAGSDDYQPANQRQMKQSWRHLCQKVREGMATELDLERTVRQIACQRIFLEPFLVPKRVNLTELILLIDRDGSMVAFHALADWLIDTALLGGKLGKVEAYYFHNCPVGYLYRDPVHSESEPLTEILTKLRRDRAVVLIFSDAGSARGGFNQDRVELTTIFLQQLQLQVRYVAWLNPLPKSRWAGTTAEKIGRVVPMFDITREGLDLAIDVLRGKQNSGCDRTELILRKRP